MRLNLPGAEKVFRRGLVARDPAEIAATLGLDGALISGELSREAAEKVARAARQETGASHALAVLIEVDDGPDRIDFGGSIYLAIAAEAGVESRRSRIYGGRDWVRLGHRPSSASTACASTSSASPSPNAPISSGCDQHHVCGRRRHGDDPYLRSACRWRPQRRVPFTLIFRFGTWLPPAYRPTAPDI